MHPIPNKNLQPSYYLQYSSPFWHVLTPLHISASKFRHLETNFGHIFEFLILSQHPVSIHLVHSISNFSSSYYLQKEITLLPFLNFNASIFRFKKKILFLSTGCNFLSFFDRQNITA